MTLADLFASELKQRQSHLHEARKEKARMDMHGEYPNDVASLEVWIAELERQIGVLHAIVAQDSSK